MADKFPPPHEVGPHWVQMSERTATQRLTGGRAMATTSDDNPNTPGIRLEVGTGLELYLRDHMGKVRALFEVSSSPLQFPTHRYTPRIIFVPAVLVPRFLTLLFITSPHCHRYHPPPSALNVDNVRSNFFQSSFF
jgi:hypothetical protein